MGRPLFFCGHFFTRIIRRVGRNGRVAVVASASPNPEIDLPPPGFPLTRPEWTRTLTRLGYGRSHGFALRHVSQGLVNDAASRRLRANLAGR